MGLGDQGWVQGRNFVLVPQWGDGNVARLPELAVVLVNAGVDIILAEGVITTRACAGGDCHHSDRHDSGR